MFISWYVIAITSGSELIYSIISCCIHFVSSLVFSSLLVWQSRSHLLLLKFLIEEDLRGASSWLHLLSKKMKDSSSIDLQRLSIRSDEDRLKGWYINSIWSHWKCMGALHPIYYFIDILRITRYIFYLPNSRKK